MLVERHLLLHQECYDIIIIFCISGGFNVLLRELVAEFTLTDSSSTTAVCLTGLLGQSEDSVVLNSWCRASDQQIIEDAVSYAFVLVHIFIFSQKLSYTLNA